jgi:hypothetical protein
MGSQKTLTNEKYMYSNKEFQIYKTKKGVRLIKVNNNFININNVASINSRISEKNHNDIVAENISELTNLDISDTSDNNSDIVDINDSIDGEEYIII